MKNKEKEPHIAEKAYAVLSGKIKLIDVTEWSDEELIKFINEKRGK